jgi:RNA polymerase sigma-70 factor (ECF subfamily)
MKAMQEISFRRDILPLKDKLYRLALRITMDTAEAEDVVQDTMIRAWNKRGELSQYDSVEAFCLTVARNLAIDRSERMDSRTDELTSELPAFSEAPDPYERMAHAEQLQLIHRLMSELPERQRTVIQLRDVEEKTYKEIAEALQLTEDQVKVTLFRARQAIKNRYLEIDNYGL